MSATATTTPVTPADPRCVCGRRKSEHLHVGLAAPLTLYCDRELSDTFRRCDEDMPRLGVAPDPSVPLGRYAHYKGGRYVVLGGALMASNDLDVVLVLYRSEAHGYCGARPVEDFTRTVRTEDGWVRRFIPIEETKSP